MKINPINFKGLYQEEITADYKERIVMKELKRVKPYLKLLAQGMKDDIFVKIKNDGADTILSIDGIDKDTNEIYNLAKGTEHTLNGHGFNLMGKVFKNLDKHAPQQFSKAAKNFLKNVDCLEHVFHPYKSQQNSRYIVLECGCVEERK